MITRANAVYGTPAAARNLRVDAREICRVLFRHKRKMVVFAASIMLLTLLGIAFYPRTYASDARLFVRLGKESVGLDPTATLSETLNVNESRESEINSELEILRSRVLLEDVVNKLGPDYILATAPAAEAGFTGSVVSTIKALASSLGSDVSPSERAVSWLEKRISAASPKKSNVIVLRAAASSPEKAQEILRAYLDSYLVHHAQANRTKGSHDFFVEQAELLHDQLESATEKLRSVKNASSLASVEGQRDNVQAQASSIEAAILENARSRASSDARLAALQKALDDLPPQLTAEETEAPNVGADLLRTELYKVQILENEVLSRVTSEHPQAVALRQQVKKAQENLDAQSAHRNQTTRKPSPVYLDVHTELKSAEAVAAGQRAEGKLLDEQLIAVRDRIRALNDDDLKISKLTRDVELLEASYRGYASNREQARIDQAMQSGRISNVNVVQPATLVAKPASPQVPLLLVAGIVGALAGAVGLAFGAEYLDTSLRTPEQIEQELEIPVLLAVPRDAQHSVLQN